MTNIEYKNTLYEVSVILKNMDEELVKKIPKNLKEKIESDKSNNYKFEYDLTKGIDEQNILKTTKLYLTMLYLKFLCTEKEKKEVLEIMNDNETKYQKGLEKKRQKYSANDIFKDNDMKKEILKDDSKIVEYRENIFLSFFRKIRNYIIKKLGK